MKRKGQTTTAEERISIGERWERGQTDAEIAEAMGCSVWVVRKWRRRYQEKGRAGLVSPMGRPKTGALGHFPPAVRERVREMREGNPAWGPDTIRAEWARDPTCQECPPPSRSRIAAFLKQEGYTRPYERHSELPQPEKRAVKQVHEEWEMDAKGVVEVPNVGRVSIINIVDVRSRLKTESYPCLDTSHPNTRDYQQVLRRAFLQYGLPQCISLDHDSVFYDNASPSPFPTILHCWLIALGVEVRFIEKPPPAEHSLIERTHQTMCQQAVTGQDFANGQDLESRLIERRHLLSRDFPRPCMDKHRCRPTPRLSTSADPMTQKRKRQCSTLSGSMPTWLKDAGSDAPPRRVNSPLALSATTPVRTWPSNNWRSLSTPTPTSWSVVPRMGNEGLESLFKV